MKVIKIFLVLVMIVFLSGCSKLEDLSYDQIIGNFNIKSKDANTYKKGYKFYVPKGLKISDAGSNYVILTSSDVNYYMYIDLVSYKEKKTLTYENNNNSVYSQKIKNGDINGYIEIKLWENDKYLIEIMYNYAKIEVMVDKGLVNKALVNSISILNSIKYDDKVIKTILEQDDLPYMEEVFNMFEETQNNSNYLDYENIEIKDEEEKIKDTDYIN